MGRRNGHESPEARKHGSLPVGPGSENPTASLSFRWPWRPYQERVLNAAPAALRDNRLHVVAAPGSGKTSLGIEVFRRLGRPAVVLAPTRTIRDQWISRLSDFTLDRRPPAWAGTSLEEPSYFTALTYQALHTRYRENPDASDANGTEDDVVGSPTAEELSEVAARFSGACVGTVILDEAHHLRQEWWKALTQLVKDLGEVNVVSLTATPPYGVVGKEWRRYEELCGPIDEEIGVPELVRVGTLCPHQDYVWALPPSPRDVVTVREYDAAVASLLEDLSRDDRLLSAVESHPWVHGESLAAEDVLQDPEFAVSLLVYLKARGRSFPDPLVRLLAYSADELPQLDRRWWNVLVDSYLHRDWPGRDESHRAALSQRLHRDSLLERRELRIDDSRRVRTSLALSASKIHACAAIYRLERELRGDGLRLLVLTDFIHERDDERLGAWSVFLRLAGIGDRANASRVALLTGRVVALHRDLVQDVDVESASPLQEAPDFVRIVLREPVAALTRLFESGRIHVLVGTRALLGEGWDAPGLNSLVLASYVGSFMLTNQMRGRAIRSDPDQPDKAASIWYLVVADPATPSGNLDIAELRRRFDGFVGLAEDGPRIEAGLDRLGIPAIRGEADLARVNDLSVNRFRRIGSIADRWKTAIECGKAKRVIPSITVERPPKLRRLIFANTLRAVLYSGLCTFALVTSREFARRSVAGELQNPQRLISAVAAAGLLASLPYLFKWMRLAWRHAPIDGSLRQIGLAVCDALSDTGLIHTPRQRLEVQSDEVAPGCFSLSMSGGSYYEASLFTDSVSEVLDPIENPRYVVTRRGSGWWSRRRDFHAVPSRLASNRESAAAFVRAWRKRLGPAGLIYTRNEEGRRALLRARARALSTEFMSRSQRCDRWQ